MLHSCNIGDREVPIPAPDDDDGPLSATAILTETEKQAVRELVGGGPVRGDSYYRVETPDGPVIFIAKGLPGPAPCSHFSVKLRSLSAGPVEFLFGLIRAGNMFMVPTFDQWNPVTVSEGQKQRIAGHMPEARVCPSPVDLQHYLAGKVEARQLVQPDWFRDGWEEMMDDAAAAGQTMLNDRAAGELEFQRLSAAYPDEGGLYFTRGRAYEAIGETGLAAADYRKAVELLPVNDLLTESVHRALSRVTR
jgi:hypothetical protein